MKLKIKKEKKEGEAGEDSEEEASTESDWEPEAEIVPAAREKSRSGRQRKRPSFFQEFESQENNLDSILAEFEQNQVRQSSKVNSQFSLNILSQLPGRRVWKAETTQTSKTSGREKTPEAKSSGGGSGADRRDPRGGGDLEVGQKEEGEEGDERLPGRGGRGRQVAPWRQ